MAEQSLVLLDELNNESYALGARGVLGDCLVAMEQLSDAREDYEWTAGVCEKLKARRLGAEVELRLARLSLEEGSYDKAEAHSRRALAAFAKESLSDDQARALSLLAMALLGSKQPVEARAAADRASAFAAGSQTMIVRLDAALSAARVRAASLRESGSNSPPASLAELIENVEAILSEATGAGFAEASFEARLLLGELEIASDRLEAGRGRLSALEREARAKGHSGGRLQMCPYAECGPIAGRTVNGGE